ncbi:MAG: helix-turn-helix domain-containing protein [Mycolicibacterium frederiksbergense]|nr:helix-turn-helix domain-containing protein [Mycolicibacterium frederiksbergense]
MSAERKATLQKSSCQSDVRARKQVVELYASGLSAIAVAERLSIGRSTVLKILKQEGSQPVVAAEGEVQESADAAHGDEDGGGRRRATAPP